MFLIAVVLVYAAMIITMFMTMVVDGRKVKNMNDDEKDDSLSHSLKTQVVARFYKITAVF